MMGEQRVKGHAEQQTAFPVGSLLIYSELHQGPTCESAKYSY